MPVTNLIVAVPSLHDLLGALDAGFSRVVATLETVVFFEIGGMPLIVLWMIAGSLFFTLRLGFINIRGMRHALAVLLGKYDAPEEEGEVSHFQAMATALSATVGLGNIAGVAIAIDLGGPGVVLWMTLAGLLGMSAKFVECTLGQKYRRVKPDGTIAGGPMYYLAQGLRELGWPNLGKGLAIAFALLCVGSTFGVGNMFQANQSFAAIAAVVPAFADWNWLYGILLAAITGLVIIGGISRIGTVAGNLVPAMLGIYTAMCLWIVCHHFADLPLAIATIVRDAFVPQAVSGGIVGVLVCGVQRSVFSNGAGGGTAAIAHAAARTQEPVREGILASLEPFIDTVVICNLTAIAIIVTGVYRSSDPTQMGGVELTAMAFGSAISWFPAILAVVVVLFAFSSIIACSYYGEQCWSYLFGDRTTIVFKFLFLSSLFVGSVTHLGVVLDFSDMMILLMSVPNLLGCFLLSNRVAADLKHYLTRLQSERRDRSPGRESVSEAS